MRFRIYIDQGGNWRWRLVARNGRIIADSGEGYKTKRACLHGIRLVRRAWETPIDYEDEEYE